MKGFFYRIFCGFFLGISIFAPGVSGSVMAIIMGIYNRLLEIASNPLKNFKRNFQYLFPMGIGAVISLMSFVLVFGYLFDAYEKATSLLFIGLIAGNIPLIFKEANQDGFKKHYLVGIVVSFSIALTVGIISSNLPEIQEGANASVNLLYLGISGLLAGMTSLIPGMSVSMILMVLGVYGYLMYAAKTVDIPVIAVVGFGFVAAMILSSRLIKFIFRRYHGFANYMVFGFMCGSIVGIFFGLPKDNVNFNWLIGALMFFIGLSISLLFVVLGKKFNLAEKENNMDDPLLKPKINNQ